jgi:putative membrane protein
MLAPTEKVKVINVMWGYGLGWGSWLIMGLSMLLFWALIILGIIALVRFLVGPRDRRHSTGSVQSSAEQVLAERFARGEIDEEEYRQRREVLRGGR